VSERAQRQLSAILAADVAGYSRLIGFDEEGTLARLKELRRTVIDPKIGEHRGRIVKTMGDGLLVQFASAVDAVRCAVDIQRQMAEQNAGADEDRQIEFRIGINLGDIVVEGEDILGDGVNIAARLETFAEPGGICVSGNVHDQVRDKLDIGFADTGEQQFKNIAHPVRVYRASRIAKPRGTALPARGHASIAVLPFVNMSSDPEQEYFADGLADDLITDLSKVSDFTVIARNSSFAYKGKSIDVRLIARELGVRYIIEGSVRRSATRVRINAQLIDAAEQSHIWADRFDRDLVDVFEVQDEIVGKIVSALSGALPPARRKARSLQAYDLFVRGRALSFQSPESNRTARPLLEKAIEIDPEFAEAHAWLALSHLFRWTYGGEAKEPHHSLALAGARRAVALDPENADAHTILGYLLMYESELDAGEAELQMALRIDANHADAWAFLGDLKVSQGFAQDSVELVLKAFRLNPHAPGRYYWLLGYTQYAAHRYEEALQALRHPSTYLTGSTRLLAASLAQLGRLEEAKEEARHFLAINPHFSVKEWANLVPFRRNADRQHFIEGYLKAGLPE
jgi:TolB-like protein/tetratricopeptide (TPR) repeat protein